MKVFALASVGNALCESLEFLVESDTTTTLFLLLFELFFVAISVTALAIASFVELHFGRFTVELNVLGLALTNYDRILEMHVNDDDEFLLRRLEEEVLDVGEEHVDFQTAKMNVSDTVLVNFDGTTNALTFNRRTEKDIVKPVRTTI